MLAVSWGVLSFNSEVIFGDGVIRLSDGLSYKMGGPAEDEGRYDSSPFPLPTLSVFGLVRFFRSTTTLVLQQAHPLIIQDTHLLSSCFL